MDAPLPENRSNILVYAVLIAAIIALVLGIFSLTKINALQKQVGSVGDLAQRLDLIDQKASRAETTANQANSTNNQALRALAAQMQREVSEQFQMVRDDISRIDAAAKSNTDKLSDLESRGIVRSTSTPGGSGGAAAPAGGTPGQLAEDGTYVIKSGDTLGAIGRQFGIPWQEIQRANPGLDPNRLRPGTKIVIPKAP